MKKFLLFLTIPLITITFNACVSFQEEYKPLYQVKPEIEPVERTK
ncbi:hypothetical protein [Halarcobacter anaerophilus]|nr:hypothetical protein [Halarcobacter anaerophilus]